MKDVLVLICGHGGRDARCGLLGPVLKGEFKRMLKFKGVNVAEGPVQMEESSIDQEELGHETGDGNGEEVQARVGLISHIGGHKFAGNIIIYIPPTAKIADGKSHPLAGSGIWYGRVTPEMVEGIIDETIFKGKIIEDLFRGGIQQGGNILRL